MSGTEIHLQSELLEQRQRRQEAEAACEEARNVARQLIKGAGYQEGCPCLSCRLRRKHAWLREESR
jgi:hypothetical protein